jgi:uncharacterized delta-60 repeat protein
MVRWTSLFGTGGHVTADFGRTENATAIALQPDGKILAAGGRWNSSFDRDVIVSRHNGDGSLDVTFGDRGKVISDFGGSEGATSIGFQSDSKIVVTGMSIGSYQVQSVLARYHNNGSPDETFGERGQKLYRGVVPAMTTLKQTRENMENDRPNAILHLMEFVD